MKKKYQRKPGLVNKTGYTPGYETENNPYNIIPGENITMENTPYPLYAMPLDQDGEPMGQGTVMQPGGQYRFGGASYVAEVPMYEDGGLKEKWVSKKIGILMREGYPQKQAIAIAYSMYDQKHKDGGYQLPKYQLAGTAELDEYGQPLPKPQPNSTPSTNSQTSGKNTLAPGNVNSWDIDNNRVPDKIQAPQNNPLVESKPDYNKMYMEMSTEDEQLKESEDVTADARNAAENSFQGNPMYQFLNLEGGFGTDAALFKTGQAVANKDTLGIVAGAGTSLIKGAKDFLAGMGTQNRQNQVMKSYYENQRENMTGTNRAKGLRFGGYYQDGGEEEYGDLVNKYPNRNPQIRQENTIKTDWFEEGMDKDTYYGFKNQLEAEGYKSIPKPNGMSTTNKEVSTPSARDTWVAKTGLPWSEAKRLGYTDGSAKDNIKLLSELNDPRFKKEYLRNSPQVKDPDNRSMVTPPKTQKAKAEVSTPQLKKQAAKTPQLQKKAPAKKYTQEELDAIWDNYRPISPLDEIMNPDKRRLQSGVITDKRQNMTHVIKDGKVVKSFPVLTGQNPEGNKNSYTLEQLEKSKKGRATPVGTYLMEPNANIYGKRGFNLNPIPAFGEKAPVAKDVALHVTYPGEFKQRDPLYKMPAKNRYASYGCINGRCKDTEDLADRFPKADTLMVIDSKNPKDKALLSRFGIRQNGGYYQDGGEEEAAKAYEARAALQLNQYEKDLQNHYDNSQGTLLNLPPRSQEIPTLQTPPLRVATRLQKIVVPETEEQKAAKAYEARAALQLNQYEKDLQNHYDNSQGTLLNLPPRSQEIPTLQTPPLRLTPRYQEGGMQPGMEEGIEGQMSNPQEEGMEQQGGNQQEQLMQEVAQAIQQGADPQQIVQQLVQMGIPQQQAIQMVQMVMQQLQGSQEQPQQQGTPQLRMGGYYQEGGEEMDEEMEGEYEGAENESPRLEQIEDQVEQALKQGADPQQVLQQLVQMGIPQQQAIQMIQEILKEIQNGESEIEDSEEGQPMMRVGGEYLSALKGKTIKDYTYNPKTNSYTVSYE